MVKRELIQQKKIFLTQTVTIKIDIMDLNYDDEDIDAPTYSQVNVVDFDGELVNEEEKTDKD